MTKDKVPVSLDLAVVYYLSKGYRVISQTETSAQLVKPKKFSFFWGVFWFLIFIVPFIIYLLWYLAKKDQSIYLQLHGSILTITNERGRKSSFTAQPSNNQLLRASQSSLKSFHNVARWYIVAVFVIVIIILIIVL